MITKNGKPYREFRCSCCRKLLALEYIFAGRLSIKCECGTINDIEIKSAKGILLSEGGIKPTELVSKKGGE
jgi:phage FluMu protein Com